MREGVIYCRTHYELILQNCELHDLENQAVPGQLVGLHPGFPFPPFSSGPPRLFYNGVGAAQKGRPRKRKIPGDDMQTLPSGMGKQRGDFSSLILYSLFTLLLSSFWLMFGQTL